MLGSFILSRRYIQEKTSRASYSRRYMRVTSSFLAWLIVTEYYVPVSASENLRRTLGAINDGYWKRALPTRHSTRDNRKFLTERSSKFFYLTIYLTTVKAVVPEKGNFSFPVYRATLQEVLDYRICINHR